MMISGPKGQKFDASLLAGEFLTMVPEGSKAFAPNVI